MANFYQQGQTVQYQYNAETINFGEARTPDDFRQQLRNLQAELDKAIEAKAITDENADAARARITEAIAEAEQPSPDGKTLIEHLTSARELVSTVGGLAGAIGAAVAAVGALF